MKKTVTLAVAVLLLLFMAGCSNANGEASPAPEVNPIEEPPEPAPALAELSVADLTEILAALNPSEATLTYYGETGSTCDAGLAIRAKSYIEKLQGFTWEESDAPADWDGIDEYRCVFTAPGVTLTAYQSGYNDARLLHVKTERGEGMFILPYIADERTHASKQVSWMVFEAFVQWYQEAKTAEVCNARAGTPLTAEELDWFENYTASVETVYVEAQGGYHSSAAAISCFFTSQYDDPRDMDAREFLCYCPGQGILESGDEEEFRLIQSKLDWRAGADEHLATFDEFPVPCHRLPRTYINEILMQYAGITVEDMNTNWMEDAFYIPETDCFYTFSSDFGPGSFIPSYGEKSGDTVTLWEAPNGENGTADKLVLQKNGENWHILSHQSDPIS